jgi:ribosomal protein L19E
LIETHTEGQVKILLAAFHELEEIRDEETRKASRDTRKRGPASRAGERQERIQSKVAWEEMKNWDATRYEQYLRTGGGL